MAKMRTTPKDWLKRAFAKLRLKSTLPCTGMTIENKPRLSILIPSTPSRWEMTRTLYDRVCEMCEGLEIEILLFVDNKQRTIGEKREALKNISKGKYFLILDSDDDLLSVSEIYEATIQDVDVITFDQKCRNADGSEFTVSFGLGNPVEHNKHPETGMYVDCLRPPFQMCAWASKFKSIKYPAINYGEDGVWMAKANKRAKSEIHIDKILHSYNFNPEVTEASTESNSHWKNPNEENGNS